MKRGLIFLLAACMAALTACSKPGGEPPASEAEPAAEQSAAEEYTAPPDPTRPDGALTQLLDGAKAWDTEMVDAYLPDGVTIDQYVPPMLQSTAKQVLSRLDYEVKSVTTEDDRAMVELEITAVDAESALGDAVTAAIAYVAKQQLTGKPVDDYEELAQVITDAVDVSTLSTTTATATAYMTLGSDGSWELDLSDPSNTPLLNALSGGTLEIADRVASLAASYGITIG